MSLVTLDSLAATEAELRDAVSLTYRAGADPTAEVEAGFLEVFETYLQMAVEPSSNIEALKRATFLAWYHVSEPPYLTGLGGLPFEGCTLAIDLIEPRIELLDDEFRWMLSYYFQWEYAFPELSSYPHLSALAGRHSDELLSQVVPEEMVNRGLLGRYFTLVHQSFVRRASKRS